MCRGQSLNALSGGEAEHSGIVSALSESLGEQSLAGDRVARSSCFFKTMLLLAGPVLQSPRIGEPGLHLGQAHQRPVHLRRLGVDPGHEWPAGVGLHDDGMSLEVLQRRGCTGSEAQLTLVDSLGVLVCAPSRPEGVHVYCAIGPIRV